MLRMRALRSPPVLGLVLIVGTALCLLHGVAEAAEKQTADEVLDEIVGLFDERANLEKDVKKLRDEVAKHKKQLETGNFEDTDDLSHCPKCDEKKEVEEAASVTAYDGKFLPTLNDKQNRKANSARFLGKFPFKTKRLPSINANNPKLIKMLQQGRPVIIKNSGLVKPAVDSWDLSYLVENIGGQEHSITMSHTRQFLYWSIPEEMDDYEFTPPFTRTPGVFADFVDLVEKLEKIRNGSHSYFQAPMSGMEQGPAMREDYDKFAWKWLDKVKPDHWGKLDSNLYILGMPNVVTPAHYDGLQNLFTQIRGFKRCLIFSPKHYRSMYPFPAGHPNDRQTQVDFDHPNLALFPRFRESEAFEAIVGPGDVLYIPSYWYHHIESEMDSMTMSMNFWFKGANGTIGTKPAVPPSFRSKEPAAAKPEQEESDAGPQLKHRSHGLPDNTYKLSEIVQLLLVADVENTIAQELGAEHVKSFLDYGFSSRYELVVPKEWKDEPGMETDSQEGAKGAKKETNVKRKKPTQKSKQSPAEEKKSGRKQKQTRPDKMATDDDYNGGDFDEDPVPKPRQSHPDKRDKDNDYYDDDFEEMDSKDEL